MFTEPFRMVPPNNKHNNPLLTSSISQILGTHIAILGEGVELRQALGAELSRAGVINIGTISISSSASGGGGVGCS